MARQAHPARCLRNAVVLVAVLVAAAVGMTVRPVPATAATSGACSFADPGSGTYASTLCWLDMSGYDAAQASSPGGQQFTVALPGGYTIAFTLSTSGGPVAAHTLPTYGAAYLGDTGHYSGVTGEPALYQTSEGTSSTATFSDVSVTDAAGRPVTGYALVGADAESSDSGESLRWSSDTALSSINPLGNACGGGFSGAGTTTVTCAGESVGRKSGTAILAAENASRITQTMVGGGLQAVAFGVLVSRVQLNKTVVNEFTGDSFAIAVHDASGDLIGAANTGSGTSATTGALTVLPGSDGEHYTLSETATAGALASYDQSWACTRNGNRDPSVPADSGTSVTVNLDVGDFVECTITNTAKAASLSLTKHAGTPVDANDDGLVDAGDTISYRFDVHNTGQLALEGVAVTDAKAGPVSCPQHTLGVGDTMVCTAGPYTITAADVAAGAVENTARASGTPVGETQPITSSPSSTHTPTGVPQPAITLMKSASPSHAAHLSAGQVITYSFVATNTGNVTLHDLVITEGGFSGTGTLGGLRCASPMPATLTPGEAETCTATYAATQADLDAGIITNDASVTGTAPDGSRVGASAGVTVIADPAPAITVLKSAFPSDAAHFTAGQAITYRFLVTNAGNVTLHQIQVTDSGFTGSGDLGPIFCPDTTLAPDEQVTCTASYTITPDDVAAGQIQNTATVTAMTPAGPASSAPPSTVTVPGNSAPEPDRSTGAGDEIAGGTNSEGSPLAGGRGSAPGGAGGPPRVTASMAETGSDLRLPLQLAGVLMLAGTLLIALGRRRRV